MRHDLNQATISVPNAPDPNQPVPFPLKVQLIDVADILINA